MNMRAFTKLRCFAIVLIRMIYLYCISDFSGSIQAGYEPSCSLDQWPSASAYEGVNLVTGLVAHAADDDIDWAGGSLR